MKFKVQSLLILLLLVVASRAQAREAIDFFTMPQADFPMIDSMTRMDMADYFRSGMAKTSNPIISEPVRILSAEPLQMTFMEGTGVETTIGILAKSADTLLVVTRRISMPQLDGPVTVYDASWQKLDPQPFAGTVLSDWLTDEGKSRREEVQASLPFLLYTTKFDPQSKKLTLTLAMDQYFSPGDELKMVNACLRPQVQYRYDGKRFRPVR